MSPVEALAAQPPARDRPMWFFLPQAAHEWLVGEQRSLYLPAVLCGEEELGAHEQLVEWDALAGKLLREAMFGGGDAAVLREMAEAVAAVAEQLAVALGARS